MFLQGMTYNGIAQKLTVQGIKTPAGKDKWSISTVRSILSNEKYKGDALFQKSYIEDFLTKKQVQNNGEIPQYYVEGNYEAIVEPEVFEMVQREIDRRGKGKKYHSGVHLFSSRIKCGECGSWYGSKVWHSTDKYRRVVWQCNHKFAGSAKCTTPHFEEDELKQAFVKALNHLITDRDVFIRSIEEVKDSVFSTDELDARQEELMQELNVVAELVERCIQKNAQMALDQKGYNSNYNQLVKRYDSAKAEYDTIGLQIHEVQAQKANVESFLKELEKQDQLITEFDEEAFNALLDYITVYTREDIRFTFKDGSTVKVGMKGGASRV